ncbi:MAG: SNF2-related protein, partial [Proteobacteria bacterium]|nr:SNF2-related protein [Pseudomonadota bacterium]
MDTAKSTIISHLYEHMDENDWLDGLDIYQAGHVSNLKAIESLITSKVASSSERSPSEVRIKIHPTGGSIQWIECTCRKNRVAGRYCEHIGATMIHIDREKPKVFENLDPKMPLKPPPSPVRRKPQDPTIPKSEKKANATEAVLTHLEGNIQNVALLANGPQLRVRVEIKPGHISSYNLELDEAAKFLQDHLHLSCLSPEVKKLKLYDLQLKLGTRIAPIGNSGEVVTERVVAFINPDYEKSKKSKKNSVFKSDSLTTADQYLQKIGGNSSDVYAQFLPSKNMARHMGKNWIYVEDLGYFSYDSKSVKPSWNDLPTNKIWQDDEAAWLCKRNFSEYADLCRIWLSPELELNPVVVGAEFSKVNVLGSGGVDWFSIKPEYTVGNSKISMVDILLEYRRKKREFLRAGNRWIQVPDLVKQFAWDVDEESKSIRVDKLGMIRFKAAMGELDQFAGSRKILDKIREQTEFSVEKPAPEIVNSKLNLRGYQQEGYQWMWWLFTNGLSGLLADEMGLGKTHQSMAVMTAISQNVKNAKFLVICPTTVLDHWLDKIEAFTPGINPIKYHGIKRNHLLADIDRRCITVLSSYGIVMRDIETMASITWDAVILDEAHFVKNIDTATYRAVCKLKSKSRYCLSGTPMENHLGELKAVYDFLLPGYLGSNEYFKLQYLNPIASGDGEESIGALQKLIHPFKMRRTKANVLKDLPEKVEDLRHCMLSDDQAAMYQQTL